MKPLAIELFAGLHGWGEGAAAAGFRVVGFDIVDMCSFVGKPRPAGIDLVLQNVLTLQGSQLKDAEIIFASPPCQEFSKYAMPFGALWEEHDRMDDDGAPAGNYLHKPCPSTYLFHWCFVLQREASAAAGRYIPMVVENVRGAGRFVGKSAWNFGSFHLYGDVPALMPITLKRGQKVPGFRFDGSDGTKQLHSRGDNQTCGQHRMGLGDGQKAQVAGDGKAYGGDFGWDGSAMRVGNRKSNARKMASAMIAKIPRELADHIARVYYPQNAKTAQP